MEAIKTELQGSGCIAMDNKVAVLTANYLLPVTLYSNL